MFERLIGNKIHVVNSFYGDIKPRVTSVELISLSDTKCKFKIYATLENINEYFIKVTKGNKKIFGNTESEETEDYVLKLRRDYFFKSNKYLINLNKRSLKDIKLENLMFIKLVLLMLLKFLGLNVLTLVMKNTISMVRNI